MLYSIPSLTTSFNQLINRSVFGRPYEVVVGSGEREKVYTYPKGTTPLLSTKIVNVIDTSVVQVGGEAMEVI